MSNIVRTPRPDPEAFEGQVRAAADRFEVREVIRTDGTVVAVHERFGIRSAADQYAADRTQHEPAMYGAGAPHELVVNDTVWAWRR